MEKILKPIQHALLYFSQPDERIYYPYLISSAIIAALLFLTYNKSFKGLLTYVFPYKRLIHISSLNDILLLIINHVINVVFFLPFLINSILLAYLIQQWMNDWFGESGIQISDTEAIVYYAVAYFIISDFSRYVLHFLLHKISFLWEFHKVHHSAEVLTPITLYRVHPVESMLFQLRSVFIGGLVSGVFLWIYPYSITPYVVWGVHVGTFVFNLLGANLRHSHVWLSFGKYVERIFISPAQHIIHHSNDPKHFNKNMGSELAIWDWLFKTLYITKEKEDIKFGVEESKEHRSLVKIIFQPFGKVFRRKK